MNGEKNDSDLQTPRKDTKMGIFWVGGRGGDQVVKGEFFSLFTYEFIYYAYILNFNTLSQLEVLFSRGCTFYPHPPHM